MKKTNRKNRREFLKKLGLVGSMMLLPTIFSSCSSKLLNKGENRVVKNSKLKTIKSGFEGNLMKDGEFQNLYGGSGRKSLWEVAKWKFSLNPQKEIKESEEYKLKVIKNSAVLKEKEDYICWLGHASFLIQIDGKKILTDPCLTNPPTVDRLTELPLI